MDFATLDPQIVQSDLDDKAESSQNANLDNLVSLMRFHYPRYEELPNELMFLDEIIVCIAQAHRCIPLKARNGKVFTNSMASNYIKSGLTGPPIGKKYTRDHHCLLMFAASMKLMYTAEQVLEFSRRLFGNRPVALVNDAIGEAIDQSFAAMARYLPLPADWKDDAGRDPASRLKRASDGWNDDVNVEDPLIDVIAYAFAAHTVSLTAQGRGTSRRRVE